MFVNQAQVCFQQNEQATVDNSHQAVTLLSDTHRLRVLESLSSICNYWQLTIEQSDHSNPGRYIPTREFAEYR